MGICRVGSTFVGWVAIGFVLAAVAPVGANERSPCDLRKATAFRSAADRYVTQRRYDAAADWYLAASRFTRPCRTPQAALLGARSLAQAGTAYAQSGDYLPALDLLHTARARLAALVAADDARIADAAQPYLDLVERVIGAVNGVAEASM